MKRHNYIIVQNLSEIPQVPKRIKRLYLDFETTSYDPKKDSLNPWRDCWISGVAVTWDDMEECYYLPIGHNDQHSEEKNLPESNVLRFVQDCYDAADIWVNHNIKYDCHVAYNAGLEFHDLPLCDTLTQAKLVQSDRWTFSEDALAKDWLELGPSTDMYKQKFLPWIEGNKDWGNVPIRLMGPYACDDVWKNRELDIYIQDHLHEDCLPVSANEQQVTRCLVRAEQVGLCVNSLELQKKKLQCLAEMEAIMLAIQKEHGILIRPNTNADCYEIFHHKYNLPVVRWTGEFEGDGEPSYDKYALATLEKYPGAPLRLIELVKRFRFLVSLSGTFVQSYMDKSVNGVLHPSFNQAVRTGRMSCKEPNAQQLNKPAKQLIHPPKGYVLMDFDFSSIEFRLIAQYLGQEDILQKFRDDPDADFHQVIADMCGIERKPAKNINFAMAFGGGRGRVLKMLAADASIIADIDVDNYETTELSSQEIFQSLCEVRAASVFDQYHRMLYKLRPLTQQAAQRLKTRGYVRNLAGRHRSLPTKAAYRALNTVIQSSAADILKYAIVATSPIFNEKIAAWGVEQVAFVHDSIVFAVPEKEADNPAVTQEIAAKMINPPLTLTVPMRVSCEVCRDNWGDVEKLGKDRLYHAG